MGKKSPKACFYCTDLTTKHHCCFPGADLGGSRGPVPPSKIFYLYVTATATTYKNMKISFNDVLSFINVTN